MSLSRLGWITTQSGTNQVVHNISPTASELVDDDGIIRYDSTTGIFRNVEMVVDSAVLPTFNYFIHRGKIYLVGYSVYLGTTTDFVLLYKKSTPYYLAIPNTNQINTAVLRYDSLSFKSSTNWWKALVFIDKPNPFNKMWGITITSNSIDVGIGFGYKDLFNNIQTPSPNHNTWTFFNDATIIMRPNLNDGYFQLSYSMSSGFSGWTITKHLETSRASQIGLKYCVVYQILEGFFIMRGLVYDQTNLIIHTSYSIPINNMIHNPNDHILVPIMNTYRTVDTDFTLLQTVDLTILPRVGIIECL